MVGNYVQRGIQRGPPPGTLRELHAQYGGDTSAFREYCSQECNTFWGLLQIRHVARHVRPITFVEGMLQ